MSMGLCVTPTIYPDSLELNQLNPPYFTSILYSLSDIHELLLLNRPLIIRLNNECKEVKQDWSGWDNAVFKLCSTLQDAKYLHRLLMLGCGNELDLYWHENGSTPPEFAADITRRASRIARNFGVKVVPTSLAGPQWHTYLSVLHELVGSEVQFYDFHPYGQRPNGWKDGQKWGNGNLDDAVRHILMTGKNVIFSECGVKLGEAGNEQEVSAFLTATHNHIRALGVQYNCWFAYSDLVGKPDERGQRSHGLKSEHGLKRHAWDTFGAINASTTSTNDVELEKWASLVGRGLLDMMKVDGTLPAMASEWRPFDRPPTTPATIEQCIGLNNVTYCWNLKTNSGWRIRPSSS